MRQAALTILLIVGFLMNGFHDLLDIPGWTHGRQVRQAIGLKKTIIGAAVNAIIPGVAAALAIHYWRAPVPNSVRNFWLIYCGAMVAAAIGMWWIPYFRGTDQTTKDLYAKMYAGTIQVLPRHGENPRPNLFHIVLHTVGVTSLILAAVLRVSP